MSDGEKIEHKKEREEEYALNILSLDVFSERKIDSVMIGWL